MRLPPIALTAAALVSLAGCGQTPPASPAANGAAAPAATGAAQAQPTAPATPGQAAAVINLGPRPAAFANADPTAYSQWLAGQALTGAQRNAGGAPCPAATVTSAGVSDASPPFLQAPAGHQFIDTSGVEHLVVQGCGHTDRLNILVLRYTTGEWIPARLLDGDTIAGPVLEHDALTIAVGAMAAASGCGQPLLVTTHLTQPPAGPHTPWVETWTGNACGKPIDVLMTFTPDATGPGTSINASFPRGG
jgi:hypothetical protein